MDFDELVQRCIDSGVRWIEFSNLGDTLRTDKIQDWHFELWPRNPCRWIHVPKPWTLRFAWLGWKDKNPNRLWKIMPFMAHCYEDWHIGLFRPGRFSCSCGSEITNDCLSLRLRKALDEWNCEYREAEDTDNCGKRECSLYSICHDGDTVGETNGD